MYAFEYNEFSNTAITVTDFTTVVTFVSNNRENPWIERKEYPLHLQQDLEGISVLASRENDFTNTGAIWIWRVAFSTRERLLQRNCAPTWNSQ